MLVIRAIAIAIERLAPAPGATQSFLFECHEKGTLQMVKENAWGQTV
jgi:hypothetical protein